MRVGRRGRRRSPTLGHAPTQLLILHEELPPEVETTVKAVPAVTGVKVDLVFDPPWDMSRMSDEARFALNMW